MCLTYIFVLGVIHKKGQVVKPTAKVLHRFLVLDLNVFRCIYSQLCVRGRTHIFKYLERQAAKHERARGGRARRGPLEARGHATLDTRSHRRHNVDSGYSTSDGVDKRWSQEIHSAVSAIVLIISIIVFYNRILVPWISAFRIW